VVRIDHQRDARADRLAHRARHRSILLDAEADLQLHRREAVGDVARGLLGEILERIARLAPVKPGRIGAHLGAQRPAHQPVCRDAEVLSLDVPERDVDAAQTLDDDALLSVIAQAGVDQLPERVRPQRVRADQPGGDGRDHRRGHRGGAVALAPAGDPRIGLDLDQ